MKICKEIVERITVVEEEMMYDGFTMVLKESGIFDCLMDKHTKESHQIEESIRFVGGVEKKEVSNAKSILLKISYIPHFTS